MEIANITLSGLSDKITSEMRREGEAMLKADFDAEFASLLNASMVDHSPGFPFQVRVRIMVDSVPDYITQSHVSPALFQ